MKNIFKKRINKLTIIFTLVLFAIIGVVGGFSANRVAYAYSLEETEIVKESLYKRHIPTIDDDFAGDKIIVTLKPGYSGVNKSINIQSFKTENIITKQEASKISVDAQAAAPVKKIVIDSIEDLTYMEHPSKITYRENFSQILELRLQDDNKENVLKAIKELEQLDCVLAAEPDYNFQTVDLATDGNNWYPTVSKPKDDWWDSQPNLKGGFGIHLSGEEGAWKYTTGYTNPRIKVGILEANIGENDDLRPIERNFTPEAIDPNADKETRDRILDKKRHGTHVAGIIGAKTNNNKGVAGIAQVDIALLDSESSNFAKSLCWALENDIKIVNASYCYVGGDGKEPTNSLICHEAAIKNFGDNGGLLVAAAGNENVNTDNINWFPAAYADATQYETIAQYVISVGAIDDSNGKLAEFDDNEEYPGSNYGDNSVQIYAPGKNIYSTLPGTYGKMSGTSMAAPHVAGVAALLLSLNPSLTGKEMKELILNYADEHEITYPKEGKKHKVKILNAYNVVSRIAPLFEIEYIGDGCAAIAGVKSYANLEGEITIPEFISSYHITKIYSKAFKGNTSITKVRIPTCVELIWNSAFEGCANLEKIEFYKENDDCSDISMLKYIDMNTFRNSGLIEIEIPPMVDEIEEGAFEGCKNLTRVSFCDDSHFKRILNYAFRNCVSLNSITIPDGVNTIGEGVFNGCESLTNIEYFAANCNDFTEENSPFNKIPVKALHITMYKSVEKIPSHFLDNAGFQVNIKIYSSKLEIGEYAFNNVEFDEIKFNATFLSLYGIGAYAFANSNIKEFPEIIRPYEVTKISIGDNAFYNSELKSLKLNMNYTTLNIGSNAFGNCKNLTTINFIFHPYALIIGAYAFSGSALSHISLRPDSQLVIGEAAFEGCGNLESVTLNEKYPHNASKIGAYAFKDTAITKFAWPLMGFGNAEVYPYTFYNTPLESITFPHHTNSFNLIGIGEYAFYNTALREIDLGLGVWDIGKYAFYKTNLSTISIPAGVSRIREYTFAGCANLKKITFSSHVNIGIYAFSGCGFETLEISPYINDIGAFAFQGCKQLITLSIPDTVIKVSSCAFYNCSNLLEVNIVLGATQYQNFIFTNDKNLNLINITINGSAPASFGENSAIFQRIASRDVGTSMGGTTVNIKIENALTVIPINTPQYLFNGATDIVEINFTEIKNNVNISETTFTGCTGVKSLSFPAKRAFSPKGVVNIMSNAFSDLGNLNSVIIGTSVRMIYPNAFKNTILSSATFINKNWEVSQNDIVGSGINLSNSLSDNKAAAVYLKNTYANYYWICPNNY